MVVDWGDANKLHCPHNPEHATWVAGSGKQYAVCRMASRHLYNTMNMLSEMEVGSQVTFDTFTVEYWMDVFDRELSRRYANRVIGAK